jgi:hypothetical protein
VLIEPIEHVGGDRLLDDDAAVIGLALGPLLLTLGRGVR